MKKWYVQNMMVFSKKEKIKKMTDNLIKIELLDNSQISNVTLRILRELIQFNMTNINTKQLANYGESCHMPTIFPILMLQLLCTNFLVSGRP